jgi:putative transcriptional regulator
MNNSDFEKLIESVKEAGRIKRGEIEPARTFQLKPEDVKAIRTKPPPPGDESPG